MHLNAACERFKLPTHILSKSTEIQQTACPAASYLRFIQGSPCISLKHPIVPNMAPKAEPMSSALHQTSATRLHRRAFGDCPGACTAAVRSLADSLESGLYVANISSSQACASTSMRSVSRKQHQIRSSRNIAGAV